MQQQTTEAAPTPSPSPAGGPSTATPTPHATEDEKGLSAVAYILTWITGLIIFFVAKKDQRYTRWNALQAIGLGVGLAVIGIALTVLQTIFLLISPALVALIGVVLMLFWLLVLVLIILCAVKAYQGTPI